METLTIPATNETPEINFDFANHSLLMRGESYPENAMAFYAPIRASLADYLPKVPKTETVKADFHLSYFNSSSTKLIRALFTLMQEAAHNGTAALIKWYHDPEDDMMIEFGRDLKEEFVSLQVEVIPTAA